MSITSATHEPDCKVRPVDTVFNYSSYTVAAILFLLLTIPLARFTDHLIGRDQARRLAGARL